jgi:Protein phosphatase 2C
MAVSSQHVSGKEVDYARLSLARLVLTYPPISRLLFNPQVGLCPHDQHAPRNWTNVIEHCLTTALVAQTLTKLLNLPKHERRRVVGFLMIHDIKKRLERDKAHSESAAGKDATERIEKVLRKLDPSGILMRATGEHFTAHALKVRPSLAERIVHYVDSCVGENMFTAAQERIAELRLRRPDLTAKFGEVLWKNELKVARQEETALLRRVRKETSAQGTLDRILTAALRGASVASLRKEVTADITPTRSLSRFYYAETILHTPRSRADLNEDALLVRMKDNTALAAVCDGATQVHQGDWPFKDSPGRLASQSVIRTLLQGPILGSISEKILNSSGAIRQALLNGSASPNSDHLNACSTTVLVAQMSLSATYEGVLEFGSIGDCVLISEDRKGHFTWWVYGDRSEAFELREIRTAAAEARELELPLKYALSKLSELKKTRAVIEQHRASENSPSAYGALKGNLKLPIPFYYQGRITFDRAKLQRVYLLSDGALPWITMRGDQRLQFVENALHQGGISELFRQRRALGNRNRNCTNPPCFKAHDDFAAVMVEVR